MLGLRSSADGLGPSAMAVGGGGVARAPAAVHPMSGDEQHGPRNDRFRWMETSGGVAYRPHNAHETVWSVAYLWADPPRVSNGSPGRATVSAPVVFRSRRRRQLRRAVNRARCGRGAEAFDGP
nr:hypothetical protein GCM10017611_03970 [Rhodococcus wratislaviensis]